jgi:hypothetical protein
MSFVRQNMGAVTLLDDRTTKKINKITRGDLIFLLYGRMVIFPKEPKK